MRFTRVLALVAAAGLWAGLSHGAGVIDVGTRRQLFLDASRIERASGVDLVMHGPTPREVVLERDKPWEGPTLTYASVFRDGDRFRLYYRASGSTSERGVKFWNYTATAESRDGIRWTKPDLGIVSFAGSKANNLVWPVRPNPGCEHRPPAVHSLYCEGSDPFPFRDGNPAAPPDERYKALANLNEYELIALASPDGIHWRKLQEAPVISYLPADPMMDPPNLAFWDEGRQEYVAYLRTWINYRFRGFRRSTSKDFRRWTTPEFIDLGDSEPENLYTNMTVPYERAPGTYLMFAKRFVPWRKVDPTFIGSGLSEIVLLGSRDGLRFERTFMEPFLKPGLDRANWHARGIMMGRGILTTSPTELSLYYFEHYATESVRLRRATIRPDGFVSATARFKGGEFTTPPLRSAGGELELNYSTSVAGSSRVEVQDENGRPVPGYRLEDCDEIFGDELERVVSWRRGHADALTEDRREVPYRPSDLGRALGGRAIRLRFVMKAADLFAFRFR
jgi:hypothetical protein